MEPILSLGYGYGFAVGIGAAFALLMALITKVLSIYLGQVQNSERFSTASRNVKSGLIASSTVSAWTWPATLLLSGAWSYSHGVSGGYFYGIGGTIQITLFLFLALQLKQRAPKAHTVSECFAIRFGKAGHWMFLVYCMSTNVLISALLLLGGSQGFAATTGMNTVAASFLLPLGVVVYTALGGLKATFVSDWIHTVIIYVILLTTCYTVYCSSSLVGSPGKMYDLLQEVERVFPSLTGESYLSFKDSSMFYLTWSVTLGGLSSVFGDPGYSQRAIASDPTSVFGGYLMGGLCWCIIPMALGSSAGLACRALLTNPASVTYPNALTSYEVDAGLPVIYGMAAIFGKSGAAAALVMLFMSVTSATSAELIAFSSVTTYDIFRTYIRPNATGKQLVFAAHVSVVSFGIAMAVIATILNYVGVTTGWLLSFVGIVLTPEVSAVVLTLFWLKMTKLSLLVSCPLGTVTGVVCWIGATYSFADGVINKLTVMTSKATFVGNITALVSTPIYIAIISYLKPDIIPFDLDEFNQVVMGDDVDKEEEEAVIVTRDDKRLMKKQSWISIAINIFIVLGCYIVIPCALYGALSDFSRSSFTGFIVVVLMWLLLAAMYIIFLPLWQGRHSLKVVLMLVLGKTEPVEVIDASSENSYENVEVLHEAKA